MTEEKKVWVLTCEINEYNQEGEYFIAVFEKKPTLKELAEKFRLLSGTPASIMSAVAFLEHVLSGGGRQQHEDRWYNLRQVAFGEMNEG